MKNWERNFCLASVADAPSSGETVRSARHPAGVTLDPECSPQSGTALRNGGNMVLPLCGVGGCVLSRVLAIYIIVCSAWSGLN